MKRSDFVRSLVGVAGIASLSGLAPERVKQYEKVYLKQFFVRGFSYYDGPKILHEINKSGLVELVREPENKFDERAIAIHFNQHKIGYVPRESNKTISILLDTELLEFHAEVTHIEPLADSWEQIRVAVYALKEIKDGRDLELIEPFAGLYTPTYYSLRSGGDTVTKINLPEGDDDNDGFDFGTFTDVGVCVVKTIESKFYEARIPVMFYSYDSVREFDEACNVKTLLRYTCVLPEPIDEEDLSMKLVHTYFNSDYCDLDRAIFAVNIHKWLDDNYRVCGLEYATGRDNIAFLEVQFELKTDQSPDDDLVILVDDGKAIDLAPDFLKQIDEIGQEIISAFDDVVDEMGMVKEVLG